MASYDFGDVKADSESKDHPDFQVNLAAANEVCNLHNTKMPEGLTLYVTDRAFGIHFKHPVEDARGWSGVTVKFNQDNLTFVRESNDACQVMQRYAKRCNSPKAERSISKVTTPTGSVQKGLKSRLNDEGDVIW